MGEQSYRIIELVGSSENSIEDAVKNALSAGFEDLQGSKWLEVAQIRGKIGEGNAIRWQVILKVGSVSKSREEEQLFAKKSAERQVEKREDLGKQDKYRCTVCGYIYDPEKGDTENGVNPGTAFRDLPDNWTCPVCGASKDQFEKIEE